MKLKRWLNSPMLWLALLIAAMLLFAVPVSDVSGSLRIERGNDTHILLLLSKSQLQESKPLLVKVNEQKAFDLRQLGELIYRKPYRLENSMNGSIYIHIKPPTSGWRWLLIKLGGVEPKLQ